MWRADGHFPVTGLFESLHFLALWVSAAALGLETQEVELAATDDAFKELVRLGVNLHLDDLSSGYSTLKRVTELPFDVIVLDRMLPGLDGLSVLKRLRAAGNRTPVLLLTGLMLST